MLGWLSAQLINTIGTIFISTLSWVYLNTVFIQRPAFGRSEIQGSGITLVLGSVSIELVGQ